MKKLICLCLAMGMTLLGALAVYGEQEVAVEVDGDTVTFNAQKPVIVNGRTLIPLRGVFEKMGYAVEWVGETKTAVLKADNVTVKVSAGKSDFQVNNQAKALDVPAQIMNGSMMLPLRAVGEAAGANVTWNGAKKLVEISTKGLNPENVIADSDYLVNYSKAVGPLGEVKKLCIELQSVEGDLAQDKLKSYYSRLTEAKTTIQNVKAAIEALEVPDDMEELHSIRLEAVDKLDELTDVLIDYCSGEIDDQKASDKIAEIAAAESEISKRNSRATDNLTK